MVNVPKLEEIAVLPRDCDRISDILSLDELKHGETLVIVTSPESDFGATIKFAAMPNHSIHIDGGLDTSQVGKNRWYVPIRDISRIYVLR